jgi:HEPN domain-containing protein
MAGAADLARELLALAAEDELAARALIDVAGVSDTIVGFHTQQSVEKALKAVLASRGVEFPFTPDLDGLAELCSESGLDIPAELAGVDRLTPYGVRWRYGIRGPANLDRDQALRWAAGALAWARFVTAPGVSGGGGR